jgi:hypothetical protein
MTKLRLVLTFALVLVATSLVSRPAHAIGGEPGRSTLGLGIILGAPTGLSLELRLGPRTAFDVAVGIDNYEHNDYYVHFDYLVYLIELSRGGTLSIPFYLGIGLVLWDGHYGDRDNDYEDDMRIGARVPFGLALAWRRAPVQIFLEGAVRILFYDDRDRDYDTVDLTGAAGFRVYF